jgi:hypothetical protein
VADTFASFAPSRAPVLTLAADATVAHPSPAATVYVFVDEVHARFAVALA